MSKSQSGNSTSGGHDNNHGGHDNNQSPQSNGDSNKPKPIEQQPVFSNPVVDSIRSTVSPKESESDLFSNHAKI